MAAIHAMNDLHVFVWHLLSVTKAEISENKA